MKLAGWQENDLKVDKMSTADWETDNIFLACKLLPPPLTFYNFNSETNFEYCPQQNRHVSFMRRL